MSEYQFYEFRAIDRHTDCPKPLKMEDKMKSFSHTTNSFVG